MGLIIRTAGAERNKAEIKRDYEYLMRLWSEVRDTTLNSVAPSLIYEEGDLIKRALRDLYTRDIEEVLVEGEEGYKGARRLMQMLMPSRARLVKLYDDEVPLFYLHRVEDQLDKMYSPTVQLPAGGSIVIHSTEALTAIDVNSGRSTRERHIDETAVKTNLEAADEVARQLRLARPRRPDRDRLHRHGGASPPARRREAAARCPQGRPRPHPDGQDQPVRADGAVPPAAAAEPAGAVDPDLPDLLGPGRGALDRELRAAGAAA